MYRRVAVRVTLSGTARTRREPIVPVLAQNLQRPSARRLPRDRHRPLPIDRRTPFTAPRRGPRSPAGSDAQGVVYLAGRQTEWLVVE